MRTVYEEIHRIGIIPVAKLDKPEEDSVWWQKHSGRAEFR